MKIKRLAMFKGALIAPKIKFYPAHWNDENILKTAKVKRGAVNLIDLIEVTPSKGYRLELGSSNQLFIHEIKSGQIIDFETAFNAGYVDLTEVSQPAIII